MMIYFRRSGFASFYFHRQIIIILFGVSHLMSVATKIAYQCSNEDDFYYAVPGSRCTSYYKCMKGNIRQFECLSGTIFDFYKQSCVRTAGICYEPICTGRIDGKYQDTTHACRRSYVCIGGNIQSLDNCPYGQLFNGQICADQTLVVCELPETTAIAYPFTGDKRCYNQPNGKRLVNDSNCKRYLICKNSEVVDDLECQDGYKFDESSQECKAEIFLQLCDRKEQTLCIGKSDGLHADPMTPNCSRYVKCSKGKVVARETCGFQAVFNGVSCVPSPLYECPAIASAYEPHMCKNKANGFISDPRHGCSSYIKCIDGKISESFRCSENEYFDPSRGHCVMKLLQQKENCAVSYSPDFCFHQSTGYYQDRSAESSCRKYFYCFNGQKTTYQCESGKLFNGENCVPATSYKCPNMDSNSCDLKPDGYYKDDTAGCRAYFYCSQGRKYSYLCNENQYFNGHECALREPEQLCKNMEKCRGKLDGYYHDIESNCRKYFYCLREEIVTSIACRGDKVFNGHKCVPPNTFICSASEQDFSIDCVQRNGNVCSKANGFFPDIDSGCQNYYFCIGSNKSMISCGAGLVFNGEICVPKQKYSCPKYCNDDVDIQSKVDC